ncbi:MAG: DUF4240 domain-containing protein [Sandaracinaceae bacterium]|nr:DUF4240 domain-containing protein [Sandaracinaceae bacterium]
MKSEPAAPVPHVGEDVLRWWSVVESIGAHGTPSERELRLNIRLESLSDADVGSFVAFYVDRLAAAARASLWRAASAAFGECDRECFSWLRAEMIFRGRTEYERILGGDATFTEYGEGPMGRRCRVVGPMVQSVSSGSRSRTARRCSTGRRHRESTQ